MRDNLRDKRILHAAGPAGAPLPRQPNLSHRILVVDEDNDLCLLYASVLTEPSYRVDLAQDGQTGWEALLANHYSLLITEHDIPKLSGLALVEKLRGAHMALPVVMAASRLPAFDLAQNPSLQLAATLRKPFAIDELLDTVQRALCPAGSASAETGPLPGCLNWRQPMFGGHDDAPPSCVQLTINYPNKVSGWIQRISHRATPR